MSRPMRGRVRLPRKKESQRGVHLRLGLRALPALIYYFGKSFCDVHDFARPRRSTYRRARRPTGGEEGEAACRGRCGGGSASPAKRSSARRTPVPWVAGLARAENISKNHKIQPAEGDSFRASPAGPVSAALRPLSPPVRAQRPFRRRGEGGPSSEKVGRRKSAADCVSKNDPSQVRGAHQAPRRGRPRVAAVVGEGLPPPPTDRAAGVGVGGSGSAPPGPPPPQTKKLRA